MELILLEHLNEVVDGYSKELFTPEDGSYDYLAELSQPLVEIPSQVVASPDQG